MANLSPEKKNNGTFAPASKKKKKPITRKQAVRAAVVVLFCVVGVALILSLAAWGLLRFYANLFKQDQTESAEYESEIRTEDQWGFSTNTEENNTEEEMPDLHGMLNSENLPLICDTKDVTNILLMGVDERKTEPGPGLSDTLILVSVNQKTKKITLTSFLRDSWVEYPDEPENPVSKGSGFAKINSTHIYGGPELTMATLEKNFNIKVDYYFRVNFASFVTVVDQMGGLDLELTEDEIWWINLYVDSEEMAAEFPDYPKDHLPTAAGTYHLNGLQALGHGRNRRIGSDFARTERQRIIIGEFIKKAKEMSILEIHNTLTKVLPLVTTNMPENMIAGFEAKLLTYATYERESFQFPQPGMYTEINYNIIPDSAANCRLLYEKIYGEKAPAAN